MLIQISSDIPNKVSMCWKTFFYIPFKSSLCFEVDYVYHPSLLQLIFSKFEC